MRMSRPFVSCVLCLGLTTSLSVYAGERIPRGTSVISMEAETGLVLLEHEADTVRPPASMIKLMLMLLVAEGVERGDWTLDRPITASMHAQRMGGTQVFLAAGETRPLNKLMQAVAVSSANDAAMAVAEGLWGSEEVYLDVMNQRAAELGMEHTTFRSVHGLPPDRGELPDETTARDMARLGRACLQHPQILEWTNLERYRFRPGEPYRYTTNKLIREMDESDGLKTGYIRASGFCITATALRDGVRVLTVIMGHPNSRQRFQLARELLNEGMASIRKDRILIREAIQRPEVPVENGKVPVVPLEVTGDLWITTRDEDWDRVEIVWDMPQALLAPVEAGEEVGEVRAELDGDVLTRAGLVLAAGVEEATWTWKVERKIRSFLGMADD